jgi:hypothetical protein
MRPLPDDGVIREAGQYDIPMEAYHSQCCDGPSVSSSGLRKIFIHSPADFWAFSDLNDERFEEEENDAFNFGRAAHALLLGDEDFRARFAVVPDTAPPRPTIAQIKAAAEGRMSPSAEERFNFWTPFLQQNADKTLLKEGELDDINHIRQSLERHEIVPLLLEGQAEQSLIWRDEKTGIWLKSRLDMLSATGDLADLKSTSQRDPRLLMRDIRLHGYDMQLGLATMAMEHVLGVPFDPETYEGRAAILLFIYKKPPFHVMPVQVTYEALHWARLKCRAAIDTMAECMRTGHWPGPMEHIGQFTDTYEREDLRAKQVAGLLPLSAD